MITTADWKKNGLLFKQAKGELRLLCRLRLLQYRTISSTDCVFVLSNEFINVARCLMNSNIQQAAVAQWMWHHDGHGLKSHCWLLFFEIWNFLLDPAFVRVKFYFCWLHFQDWNFWLILLEFTYRNPRICNYVAQRTTTTSSVMRSYDGNVVILSWSGTYPLLQG